MRYQFIQEHQNEFPVQRMCKVLSVSASGYYAWQRRPVSQRTQANEKLLSTIRAIHSQSRKTYGSPRVHAELIADGLKVGKNRVARLMRLENLCGQRKKKQPRTTNSQHSHPVAPNRLNREFHASRPNEKWLADITYIPTAEGWLYLAVVLDLFSRKIVGWAFAASLESSLVEQAFCLAVQNRTSSTGLLHHSDRGSQYAGDLYQRLLSDQQMQVSMSRTGNCYDNAPVESFFSTLKCEQVHFQKYRTRQEAQTDIFAYILGFYNRQRRHSSLEYLSPEEFERRYYTNLS
jgi:transposase InsO family protein